MPISFSKWSPEPPARSWMVVQVAREYRPLRHLSYQPTLVQVPPKAKPAWDSNIITPGTEFMDKLSGYLRFFVQDRINRDKAWQNIKVRAD